MIYHKEVSVSLPFKCWSSQRNSQSHLYNFSHVLCDRRRKWDPNAVKWREASSYMLRNPLKKFQNTFERKYEGWSRPWWHSAVYCRETHLVFLCKREITFIAISCYAFICWLKREEVHEYSLQLLHRVS